MKTSSKRTTSTNESAAPAKSRGSNEATSYRDQDGRSVHTQRHDACDGLGCDECNQLGFTKTIV